MVGETVVTAPPAVTVNVPLTLLVLLLHTLIWPATGVEVVESPAANDRNRPADGDVGSDALPELPPGVLEQAEAMRAAAPAVPAKIKLRFVKAFNICESSC